MVAPTWDEIDSLNKVARERLRTKGFLKGEDREFRSLWRRDWTRAQRKEGQNYEAGLVLVAHKKGKHFEIGDELAVLRKDGDRLTVRNQCGKEMSVSPRQSGTAWTVCEARSMPLAEGDEIRLRAIGRIRVKGGGVRRVPNGALLKVSGIGANGQVRLADGATLLCREVVHAYASTSHASQGVTVDAVFMTDPLSREGLYVSATRGRDKILIFTSDKSVLLEASRLRSEEQMSAVEFARQAMFSSAVVRRAKYRSIRDIRDLFSKGVDGGRNFAMRCLRTLSPWWARMNKEPFHSEMLRRAKNLKMEVF